jgi:hypothetical protein
VADFGLKCKSRKIFDTIMSTKYVFFSDLGFGGLAEAAAQQPPLG